MLLPIQYSESCMLLICFIFRRNSFYCLIRFLVEYSRFLFIYLNQYLLCLNFSCKPPQWWTFFLSCFESCTFYFRCLTFLSYQLRAASKIPCCYYVTRKRVCTVFICRPKWWAFPCWRICSGLSLIWFCLYILQLTARISQFFGSFSVSITISYPFWNEWDLTC